MSPVEARPITQEGKKVGSQAPQKVGNAARAQGRAAPTCIRGVTGVPNAPALQRRCGARGVQHGAAAVAEVLRQGARHL
jgi:hypothetical protein